MKEEVKVHRWHRNFDVYEETVVLEAPQLSVKIEVLLIMGKDPCITEPQEGTS